MHPTKIPWFEFLNCISDVTDWVSPVLALHQKQVALIAHRLAVALNLPKPRRDNLVMAAMLHDVGAISLTERMETLRFEETTMRHAEVGYFLLKIFQPLAQVAEIVRFHHDHWNEGGNSRAGGLNVPQESHILHLADRIAILINPKEEVLGQAADILARIEKLAGTQFDPQLVKVFADLGTREFFWLDVTSPAIARTLHRETPLEVAYLSTAGVIDFANLFRRLIDFRSPFTATHSTGVATSGKILARHAGFSKEECMQIKAAGFLHDLGKLAIPTEILEKPGALNRQEGNIMRHHTFYTYRTLEPIESLQVINAWGSFHHERMDGSGYPFHLTGAQLPLGSRILAVADVFTAVMEDRPYRKGMSPEEAMKIIESMGKNRTLDLEIVGLLRKNFDEVNQFRSSAQNASIEEYRQFVEQLGSSPRAVTFGAKAAPEPPKQ